jgi:protein-S-isoprenylcysteine O-methyltransferase Ste14
LESEAEREPSTQATRQLRASSIIAAILPFVQSIPPLTIWGGLMTIPFISYIALLFTSSPFQFIEATVLIFFGGYPWEQIIAILGIGILVYSVVHMRKAKKEGLIKSGPYSLVRHPQYLGVVLFTLALTTRSYWIGKNTFGRSWISPELTVVIWFGTLFAYVILSLVEELHLSKTFSSEYEDYREETGFLVPFVRTRNRTLEILLSVMIPALLIAAIILAAPTYPPML